MAYENIEFWKFGLAIAVTAVPLTFLERTNPRWAWAYVLVLLLGFATANARGLTKASNYFSKELAP